MGLAFAADNAVKGWEKFPNKLNEVTAYAEGVNYYIQNLSADDYPMEYKLLDFAPKEWTLRHCALLLKAMTQTLAGYEEDIEMSNALRILGKEDFNTIYPDRNPKDIPVIAGPYTNTNRPNSASVATTIEDLGMHLPRIERPRSPDGVGSNNWAISGAKSATGLPILANDPHLGLSLPSVWYEIAITTPEFSAQGVTLLGMPGIMIGFNENIAWGETNVGHDVMDYYQMKWTDDSKTTYMLDGEPTAVDPKIEIYNVKGLGTIHDTVRYTFWGPIVDDQTDLALRWLGHDVAPGPEFSSFVDAMQCKNYDEYLVATGSFNAPPQNFVYADNNNEIALRVNGALPIKNYRQGVTITDGSSRANGWQGFIPRDQNPQERNPERGYVSSANQYSASEEYPYYFNGNFEPYRGRTVHKYLQAKDTIDLAYVKKMQTSTYSMLAEEALASMLPRLDSALATSKKGQLLKNWDFHYTADSKAAVQFDAWFSAFHELLWDEIYTKQNEIALPNPDAWVTINMIEKVADSKFYDIASTTSIETLDDIINQSFTAIQNVAMEPLSVVKNAKILHLTRLPAFSDTTLVVGGTKHSLNAIQQTFGPSWRMIVQLGEDPEAYAIYPGGQSGNPASAYYMNRTSIWAAGKYDYIKLARKPSEIKKPLFNISILP